MKYPVILDGKRHVKLGDIDPAHTAGFKNNAEARASLEKWTKVIGKLQDKQYAGHSFAILVTADGTDTAGKSTLPKHLLSRVNTHGAEVHSFKEPSAQELRGDYMRRYIAALPERGHITFFDRSYLEEVSTVRVHKEYLQKQNLPESLSPKHLWQSRFEDIKNIEQYWRHNGIISVCFYLHLSEAEQKRRLKLRLKDPDKNHKYSLHDIERRKFFAKQEKAMEDALNNLATPHTPRIILPADNKWIARALAAEHVGKLMLALDMRYPVLAKKEQRKQLKLLKAS